MQKSLLAIMLVAAAATTSACGATAVTPPVQLAQSQKTEAAYMPQDDATTQNEAANNKDQTSPNTTGQQVNVKGGTAKEPEKPAVQTIKAEPKVATNDNPQNGNVPHFSPDSTKPTQITWDWGEVKRILQFEAGMKIGSERYDYSWPLFGAKLYGVMSVEKQPVAVYEYGDEMAAEQGLKLAQAHKWDAKPQFVRVRNILLILPEADEAFANKLQVALGK